ncbi:hypothetical protein CYMTET_28492 [Cymbomonas tetramitiformis]|uniref:Calmodulin n=1 Tax=Cymbomonas tetramitiformis TaxID=36881 RepID=A0AAE0FMZ8_9CHLO|nr:hypothetical protein CYMTET_28492 [Cymbomonas tetramitiformis]|eukprot:gene8288-9844_t
MGEELFHKIDSDSDGFIDKDELFDFLLGQDTEMDRISEIFFELDTNKDGKISKAEWIDGYARVWNQEEFIPTGWKTRPEQTESYFKQLDSGDKGFLTFDDVKDMLSKENPGIEEDGLKEMFKSADKNADSQLSLAEFMEYFIDIEDCMTMNLEKTKKGLVKSIVFARLRPQAIEGGHKDAGVACSKKLEHFDKKTLTVSGKKYDFPKQVLTPEVNQEQVFDTTMSDLMDAWTNQEMNCMLFAYGQTGTGKTHTIFGTPDSLKSDELHPDWGIFPRAVYTCLKRMEASKIGWPSLKYCLTASAMEFYCGMGFDLLYDKVPVIIDKQGQAIGCNYKIIEKVSDLANFIDEVYGKRTVSKTKMNSGSSRSHTALMLTLHQTGDVPAEVTGTEDMPGMYESTTFTVMDFAGSERVDKTGGERADMTNVGIKIAKGEKLSIPEQGCLINFELTSLCTEVIIASEQHAKKKPYNPPKALVTDTIRFASATFQGRSLLGMVICISQASQNGWETWFSCEMAEKMAKLTAPIRTVTRHKLKTAYKKAQKAAAEMTKDFEKTDTKNKFYALRKGQSNGMKRYVEVLERLGASDE